ncbi:MAG: hemerythrin domain-containing protein [Kofleriaceae bacterium]|nr:hemerythrin domain-containing protein [Myxococcales bacterium]MCB9563947.1 hemerythrin domain-containing protein [Kofleriaceae bacterium]
MPVTPTDSAPSPGSAREVVLAQHARLRTLLASAEAVAGRYRAGDPVGAQLHRLLEDVRRAFAEHNRTEEELLGPILREDFAWGEPRVRRMMEEHAGEHALLRQVLAADDDTVARQLPDLVEEILAHMDAEERTFLSPTVLRDPDGAAAGDEA